MAELNIEKNNNVIPTVTVIHKHVGKNIYKGQVIDSTNSKLYKIKYSDGDIEDMSLAEIQIHRRRQQQVCVVYGNNTQKTLEYRYLIKHPNPTTRATWNNVGANEFGRLMKGIGKQRPISQRIPGMNTMKFVHKHKIPSKKKITYSGFVADVRPQKEEKKTIWLTSGNQLHYEGQKSTETAGLETIKIFLNSVISTPNARFACFDIGNMYLSTNLPTPEYMKIHMNTIPHEVIDEYNVAQYQDAMLYVNVEVIGAIYGLAQSGYLVNQEFIKHLAPYGYYPSKQRQDCCIIKADQSNSA